MIIGKLIRSTALASIVKTAFLPVRYSFVISKLFQRKQQRIKKTHQQYQSNAFKDDNFNKESNGPQKQEKKEKKDEEKEIEDDDTSYDMMGRKLEIQSNKDYIKLKEKHKGDTLPQGIGKGGLDELVYWSQSAHTPDAIIELVSICNKLPSGASTPSDTLTYNAFISKIKEIVYLASNVQMLHEFALFGFRAGIEDDEYWQKIDEKIARMGIRTVQEQNTLIQILFLVSGTCSTVGIFNFGQQIARRREDLTADQVVKICLSFFHARKGEPPLLLKLVDLLQKNIENCTAEHIAQVLPALNKAKSVPSSLTDAIEKRSIELQDQFNLKQLMNIAEYFGSQKGSKEFWEIMENKTTIQIQKQLQENKDSKTKDSKTKNLNTKDSKTKDTKSNIIRSQQPMLSDQIMYDLITKVMLTYKFSLDFIRQNIINQFKIEQERRLATYPLPILSTFAKALYIYELEEQTSALLLIIQQTMISRITSDLNTLPDQALVHVIRDYNITRHGSRDLFLFFEEVIKAKYVDRYVQEMDRNSVELLIQIYQNSGMISERVLGGLKALL